MLDNRSLNHDITVYEHEMTKSRSNLLISPTETSGYVCAIFAGILTGIKYIGLKFVPDIVPVHRSIWMSLSGVVLSLIILVAWTRPIFPNNPSTWLLLFGHSLGPGFGSTTYIIGLEYTTPVEATLIRSIRVIFLLIAQYTLLRCIHPGKHNWMEILGVLLVTFANTAGPIWDLIVKYKTEQGHLVQKG
jgi:drug/metabolite transporter (DMT)-like permease